MRTDNYQWTINYEGGTPVTGTFLDGTPWIVPNGATLTLVAVSPAEVEITTAQGTGLVQRTAINPDLNKWARDPSIAGITNNDSYSIKTCIGSETPEKSVRIPFDFRAGTDVNANNLGSGYDSTQGISQDNGIVSGITLEVGDMIITQTAYTGDFAGGAANKPWTESWGCVTVLGSVPPTNAFRPPINWDPTDKANRPIFTEGNTFSSDGVTYPNYTLFSDDPVDWGDITITYSSGLENRLGTIAFDFRNSKNNSCFYSIHVVAFHYE